LEEEGFPEELLTGGYLEAEDEEEVGGCQLRIDS
jgi:hypothetical protein